MNRIILLSLVASSFGMMVQAADSAPVDQEIADRLKQMIMVDTDAERTALAKAWIASAGTSLLPRLIDHLKNVHENGAFGELRFVLKNMDPNVAALLAERISVEHDAAQKAKLIKCLGTFDGPVVIPALRQQLDDQEIGYDRHPRGWGPVVGRVCDEAYDAIILKLDGRGASFLSTSSTSHEERAGRIAELKVRLDRLGL